MSAVLDQIRERQKLRRLALDRGEPWPLEKGDEPGHPFRGNQYTEGQSVRFEGTSADRKVTGGMDVKIVNPHSNAERVTHTDKSGRQYEGATPHIATATVQNERGTTFEAHHFTLSPKFRVSNEGMMRGKWKVVDSSGKTIRTADSKSSAQMMADNESKGGGGISGSRKSASPEDLGLVSPDIPRTRSEAYLLRRAALHAGSPLAKIHHPHKVRSGDKWKVVDDDGHVYGTHASEGEADTQLAALYSAKGRGE